MIEYFFPVIVKAHFSPVILILIFLMSFIRLNMPGVPMIVDDNFLLRLIRRIISGLAGSKDFSTRCRDNLRLKQAVDVTCTISDLKLVFILVNLVVLAAVPTILRYMRDSLVSMAVVEVVTMIFLRRLDVLLIVDNVGALVRVFRWYVVLRLIIDVELAMAVNIRI